MNTLVICLSIGQLACIAALTWLCHHAIRNQVKAEVTIIRLERYMEEHGLLVPDDQTLADYIEDSMKKENT